MSLTLVDTDILIDAALQVDDAIKCLDFLEERLWNKKNRFPNEGNLFFLLLLPNRMIRTNGFKIFHHALIEVVTCDRGAITNDYQFAACACEGHVHAACIGKKADFAFTIRAD